MRTKEQQLKYAKNYLEKLKKDPERLKKVNAYKSQFARDKRQLLATVYSLLEALKKPNVLLILKHSTTVTSDKFEVRLASFDDGYYAVDATKDKLEPAVSEALKNFEEMGK